MAQIIDGKQISLKLKANIKKKVEEMSTQPGLAVVLVGDDPASKIYVNSKERACEKAGFYSKKVLLDKNISQDKLIEQIKDLNQDPKIHGILVQMPLPDHLDEGLVIENINPNKDVDVFHPYNIGQLFLRKNLPPLNHLLAPCTPKGIMRLLQSIGIELEGKKAVVVGRSNLVGKPIATMLTAANATATICHSRTKNLAGETSQADILIAAVGLPEFIGQEMVKPGSVVIDVGINRTDDGLVGDVDFEAVKSVAGHITPVPGGVGPMTIACLLENTFILAGSSLETDK